MLSLGRRYGSEKEESMTSHRAISLAAILLLFFIPHDLRPQKASGKNTSLVIEKIEKDSAIDKAGVQVGDVLVSWRHEGDLTEVPLNSNFDWLWLEVEVAPRGPLTLTINRENQKLSVELQSAPI